MDTDPLRDMAGDPDMDPLIVAPESVLRSRQGLTLIHFLAQRKRFL
jgi:hypothetical protein